MASWERDAPDPGESWDGAGGDGMSAKFTPGPWRVDVSDHDSDVCEIIGPTQTDGFRGGYRWYRPADARLIAAAPELYMMLLKFARGDMRLPHSEYDMTLRAEARALLARIDGDGQ